jgi:hypothetical protein
MGGADDVETCDALQETEQKKQHRAKAKARVRVKVIEWEMWDCSGSNKESGQATGPTSPKRIYYLKGLSYFGYSGQGYQRWCPCQHCRKSLRLRQWQW